MSKPKPDGFNPNTSWARQLDNTIWKDTLGYNDPQYSKTRSAVHIAWHTGSYVYAKAKDSNGGAYDAQRIKAHWENIKK